MFLLFGLTISIVQAIGNSKDPSTYANIDDVYATHIDFDFAVDFDRQVFDGKVTHQMTIVNPNTSSAFFDAEGLTVSNAEFITVHGGCQIWQDVDFNQTRPNDNLGDAVEVKLPNHYSGWPIGQEIKIRLTYVTNNKTTAISWLSPSQTAGKKLPYLFT